MNNRAVLKNYEIYNPFTFFSPSYVRDGGEKKSKSCVHFVTITNICSLSINQGCGSGTIV